MAEESESLKNEKLMLARLQANYADRQARIDRKVAQQAALQAEIDAMIIHIAAQEE